MRYCCVGPAPFDDIGDIHCDDRHQGDNSRHSPDPPYLPWPDNHTPSDTEILPNAKPGPGMDASGDQPSPRRHSSPEAEMDMGNSGQQSPKPPRDQIYTVKDTEQDRGDNENVGSRTALYVADKDDSTFAHGDRRRDYHRKPRSIYVHCVPTDADPSLTDLNNESSLQAETPYGLPKVA
nr:hypothetical protein BaRGS_035331 [Batillaria attramentaria]